MKKLPLGIQNIREIFEEDLVYMDKTGFALDLIENGKHYFISRPRRFGKSLFLSTLEEIFKGNKKLFRGLLIEKSHYKWEQYPVLRFDFARIPCEDVQEFKDALKRKIESMISIFTKKSVKIPTVQEGLETLIVALSKKNRVIVLVDEYDYAIINSLKNPEIAEKNRDVLKAFFATLKSLDDEIKFTFVTGVSKFSQVSLFSGPNHLTDITMDPRYASMMGYTEEELKENFKEHLREISKTRKEQGMFISEAGLIDEIRTWYNGYRFSKKNICVYNPFSTLNFIKNKEVETYWYSSGTPSFLIDQLKKHSKSMISLDGTTATRETLMDISRFDTIDLAPLMYQTGYFTIKNYDSISRRYHLGLPNEEVRTAFFNSLVENFTPVKNFKSSEEFLRDLESHQPSFLFKYIGLGFASFAYQVFSNARESTYQGMLLSMLYGMEFSPLSERSTNTGRIGVVLEVSNTTYIMELKLDGSSQEALDQIRHKGYFKPYVNKGKYIAIIGANFSSKERNVSDWRGELLSASGEKIKDILAE